MMHAELHSAAVRTTYTLADERCLSGCCQRKRGRACGVEDQLLCSAVLLTLARGVRVLIIVWSVLIRPLGYLGQTDELITAVECR
jgi:hypothetical protein